MNPSSGIGQSTCSLPQTSLSVVSEERVRWPRIDVAEDDQSTTSRLWLDINWLTEFSTWSDVLLWYRRCRPWGETVSARGLEQR